MLHSFVMTSPLFPVASNLRLISCSQGNIDRPKDANRPSWTFIVTYPLRFGVHVSRLLLRELVVERTYRVEEIGEPLFVGIS